MSKSTGFLIAAFTFALGLAAGIIAISPEVEKLKAEKADVIEEKESIAAAKLRTWQKAENLKTDLNKANFAKRQLEVDIRKLTKQIMGNSSDPSITSLTASNKDQLLAKYQEIQKTFHRERKKFYQQYIYTSNEAAKAAASREAGEYTSKFFRERSNAIENWEGTIKKIDILPGGDSAAVCIVCDVLDFKIEFKTGISNRIQRNTKIYEILTQVYEGAPVVFSAEVISTDSEKGIKETSWTKKGGLRAPEFVVNFTDIQAYD